MKRERNPHPTPVVYTTSRDLSRRFRVFSSHQFRSLVKQTFLVAKNNKKTLFTRLAISPEASRSSHVCYRSRELTMDEILESFWQVWESHL